MFDFSMAAGAAVMPPDNEIELKPLTTSETEGYDDADHNEEARGGGESVIKDSLCQPRPLLLFAICVSVSVALISSSKFAITSKRVSTNDGAPRRPTFVRFYSPGHCGTRFLTEIFMTNDVTATLSSRSKFRQHQNQTSRQHYATSLYWNEDNLFLGPYTRTANLSLSQFQQHVGIERFLPITHMGELDIETTCFNRLERKCRAHIVPERVFKDDLNRLQLKNWNREGNTTELKRYLVEDRLPKLLKIMKFFGPKDGLNQLVKFGHTHIFYDLETYHREMLSHEFDVKWVRIRRKRINVARSFAQDSGGHRPDPCLSEAGVVICPFDKMSILKPSRIVWDAWTVFIQHLWFVDEIEARWRVFLKNQGDGRVEIFTLKFQENSDTISPADVDELAAFMNVASPREVMRRMPHLSHIAGQKMSESEMETEALQYANTAPWCRQNDLESSVGFELDCSPDAY
mmetsp:Transcript_23728/g.68231  ORF Transcript_23728/g.68231 Transcript_23728/m.68231 type:complete len:459 (+) Transcript_23728:53-1429(+)